MDGPSPDVFEAGYQSDVHARSKSTYPHIPGNAMRDGDPICDHFSFQIFENRIIACLADGCACLPSFLIGYEFNKPLLQAIGASVLEPLRSKLIRPL